MKAVYEPARAWRVAAMLFLFMAINAIDKVTVGLLAVPIMESLHLTPAQFGILGSSFFWLFAISGVVGGFMANRISATLILLCMCVVWSLVQIPMVLSASLAMLIAARVLLGVAEGPAFPIAVHACYKWFPDRKRDLPVSVLAQGGGLGLLIAGIAIPIITAHWGWRANFVVTALSGIAWVILWRAFGSEGPLDDAIPQHSVGHDSGRIPYRTLMTEPTLLCCFLFHFVSYWTLALSLTWLPAYLQRGLGYSAIDAGRLYALIVAVAMPVSVGTSWLARHMLERGATTRTARGLLSGLTLVLAGAALVVLWRAGLSPAWRVVLVGIAIGLSPAVYALVPAMIGEIVPASQRASMLALDNSIASLAGIVAPFATGYFIQGIGHAAGYEAAFALAGALLIGGGVIGACVVDPARAATSLRRRQRGDVPHAEQIPVAD
ncbi:MFS transporter [Cupriavidus pinatubonensis]|uniref:Hexuronate transporter n=1 Tax=Cupriavidus pinatubonensis TaxID=248026 RepID=A0ABN7ZRL7_9BURK|nr:MFS transporter [Cupriavidus pinatubonensis]CAG9186697.1 Hexuronate transporter [Cupriavidus pinatubonensis]